MVFNIHEMDHLIVIQQSQDYAKHLHITEIKITCLLCASVKIPNSTRFLLREEMSVIL